MKYLFLGLVFFVGCGDSKTSQSNENIKSNIANPASSYCIK
jgi:putative hemolysin